MLAVQSINFACTDFWSPSLVQMGVGVRQSVADVDTDSLLSQNWPPSPPLVREAARKPILLLRKNTDGKKRKKQHGTLRNS